MGGGQYVQQPTAPPQRLVGPSCSMTGCFCGKAELLALQLVAIPMCSSPLQVNGDSCVQRLAAAP